MAYQQALADGADALECDVRLTADGHLVCVHDRRLERTSDGRGVVSTQTLDELEALDFGSWKTPWRELDDEAPDVDADSRRVLTLRMLLEMLADYEARVELAIETKHPTRYAGLVERRLVELLAEFGLAEPPPAEESPVRVMSFSWLSMRRVREWSPRLPTVFLMERVPLRCRAGDLPLGCRIAGLSIEAVREHPSQVARLHRRGNAVHVFTVNAVEDVTLCLELGVEALITDRPSMTRELVEAVHG